MGISKQELLIKAIRQSNTKELAQLIDEKTDLNFRYADSGLTPILIAAGIGNPNTIKLLIENGADIFVVDSKSGSNVLHKACQAGNLDCVKIFVEAGAFVDSVAPSTGHTPLIDALWFANTDIVEYLINQGAGLDTITHYGFSIDEHIEFELGVNKVANEEISLCKELINNKRIHDSELINNLEMINAVISNDIAKADNLIKDNYNIDERYPICNSFNSFHTPLLIASRDGMTEIVKLLIEAGADVNAVEPTFGAVPLHKSVYNNHIEITRMLAQHKNINLDFQGYTNGYTPLHDALWHGNAECSQILIEAGAKLDLYGHDSKLPLDIAKQNLGINHPITMYLQKMTIIV